MERRNLLSATVLAGVAMFFPLTSCASLQPELYEWSAYDKATYNYTKENDAKSRDALCKMYENLIANPKGTRGIVAPGIYADYAFLLLKESRTDEALSAFNKEMTLYPESAVYLSKIIKGLAK